MGRNEFNMIDCLSIQLIYSAYTDLCCSYSKLIGLLHGKNSFDVRIERTRVHVRHCLMGSEHNAKDSVDSCTRGIRAAL